MYDNPIFQQGMTVQDTSSARSPQTSPQTTVVEQSWLYDKAAPPTGIKLANSTLVLVPFGLIALWAIALVWFHLQKKQQSHGISKDIGRRQYHAVPCRRCIFFKNNPYLKCAINPIDAMTVNAIDCADYTPQASSKK